MASLMLHLLIGEEYCNKNNIKNRQKFLEGNFAPDLAEDKLKSHYSVVSNKETFTIAAKNKVNIKELANQNYNLKDEFNKGEFFHLICDYYFYNNFLLNLPNYQQYYNTEYKIVNQLIYKEYDHMGYWIKSKYPNLNYNLLPFVGQTVSNGEMKIFTPKSLQNFVEFCSNLNLEELYNKLTSTKTI